MKNRTLYLVFPIIVGLLAGCDECTRSTDCNAGEMCRSGDCVGVAQIWPDTGVIDGLDLDIDTDTDTDVDDSGTVAPPPPDCDGDGLFWDPASELCWADGARSDAIVMSDAIPYCEGLEFAGLSDWHLPMVQELRTLIRGCPTRNCGYTDPDCKSADCAGENCAPCAERKGPDSDNCYLPGTFESGDCMFLWSSTYNPGETGGFVLNPGNGELIVNVIRTYWSALCVRSAPAVSQAL